MGIEELGQEHIQMDSNSHKPDLDPVHIDYSHPCVPCYHKLEARLLLAIEGLKAQIKHGYYEPEATKNAKETLAKIKELE